MAELKIKADSGGGTVSFKGPATTTSNAAVQLTLPVDDGTSSQYLQTNGSGVLSWATAGGGGLILQVVQEHRTDVWSESSIAPGGVTGAALTKAIESIDNLGNPFDLRRHADELDNQNANN